MRIFILSLVFLLLSGCTAIDSSMYRDNEPRLDLFAYFEVKTKGWGIVQDRKGRLLRHFVVDISGEINGDGHLVL